MRRFFCFAFFTFASCFLTGCLTTSEVKPPSGVSEARACQKTLQDNPSALQGYVIQACTNTGVWLVEQIDPAGLPVARYDFVNGEYAGPETGGSLVSVESLGDEVIRSYQALHRTLNKDLIQAL